MASSVRGLTTGEFYGAIVRRYATSDASLSIVRHEHSNDLPLHTHEQPYFCMLVEGAYTETYASESITYEPFSIALHPAGYSHSDSIPSAGASFFAIELGDGWHERLRHQVDLRNVKVRLAGDDVSWSALRVLREFLEADEPNDLLIEGLLYDMMAQFGDTPPAGNRPPWLDHAKAFIAANLSTNHSMIDVAGVANIHPVSLARAFRAHEGQTIGEYVNRSRVAQACQLLSRKDARIADIAVDLGYVDQSHLTHVFKNITGMTPGVFRSVVLQSRPS